MIVALIIAAIMIVALLATVSSYKGKLNKFKPIVDIEQHKLKVEQEIQDKQNLLEKDKEKLNQIVIETNKKLDLVNADIIDKTNVLSNIKNDITNYEHSYNSLVKVYSDDFNYLDVGVYKSRYNFATSEKYQTKLESIREQIKILVKEDKALTCATAWNVGGNAKEGERVTNDLKKLALRAFNGEVDALLSTVKYSNINKYEDRITKIYESINKLTKRWTIEITQAYFNLRIEELRLVYEYQEKLYEEKEEQRRIREMMREEEKVQREIEKAKKDAEQEEARYKKALEEAQKSLEYAKDEDRIKFEEKIRELQEQLSEAHQKFERSVSMAQQTKRGYVYVISNIGSFGENVYKIGMTRRLEPMDRVKELGDASVPFEFDVHALISSENAPELENTLHKTFNKNRKNRVNERKEFFNISLEEIEKVVKTNHGEIEFTRLAEAKEYRETLAIIEQEG